VAARVKGRIEKLAVNQTGQMVQQGDELALIYSPDLVVTVRNLLDAKRSGSAELLNAARVRLQRWGIDDAQLNDILTRGSADTELKIRSPISGHVIQKYIREGQYVDEGMPLYEVADLSTVWIVAQVYEDDLALLPAQQDGEVTGVEGSAIEVSAVTRAFPNEEFRGKLTFIYPHIDEQTRTVAVRFELPNPEHKLRPGSTATVRLSIKPQAVPMFASHEGDGRYREMLAEGTLLSLPDNAIIDTGNQKIAYREREPGVYEGVEVKLGPRMVGDDGVSYFPILEGLNEGDLVVAGGSFLVDAETRLNPAAGSIYFGSGGGSSQAANSAAVRPTAPQAATNDSA
jgi:Cu(I)/Ag(I) efflux system membrane fusion protein